MKAKENAVKSAKEMHTLNAEAVAQVDPAFQDINNMLRFTKEGLVNRKSELNT